MTMPFAALRKEERLGLAVAVAAHVALVVALLVQSMREPAVIDPPERMVVSLTDEVSLESTAPSPAAEAQAAIADTITDEPDPTPPVPERIERPQPVPVPVPRTSSRPQPVRTPDPPKQQAAPPRKSGGSRLGDDFLKGQSTGERSDNASTPAATFGAQEAASLRSAISRQLRPYWNAPQGVDAEKLITLLDWDLNPDGSLAGRPRLRSQDGITDANRPQAARHAELAIRAVQLAAPFDLPSEYYDHWKRIRNWRFDRNSSR